METTWAVGKGLPQSALYSLEKLIEWKLFNVVQYQYALVALYSLEKLIEWKL